MYRTDTKIEIHLLHNTTQVLCIEPGQVVEVDSYDTFVTLLPIELTLNSSPYTLVPVLCIEVNPHLPDAQVQPPAFWEHFYE
jgi:hypothetical protein